MTSSRWSAVSRFGSFLLLWLALMSWSFSALAMGLLVSLGATWWSLRLLPPAASAVRLGALLLQAPRLLWQSVLGGWDVARRALSPSLPLKPGFINFPCAYQKAHVRDSLAVIASMLPGSLVCDDEAGVMRVHCLDTDQPVFAELSAEARRLAPVLGKPPHG